MELLTSLNGIFPRSNNLIEETRKFEHKKITEPILEKAFNKDYKNLQNITKGLDLISDGLLCWQDLLRPFSILVKNTEVNGLVRYFETNCFYRKILLPKNVEFDFEKIYPKYFRFGNTAFLPSISTFKFFSNANYSQIVTVLTEIIKFLCYKKYKYIVLQEPALVFNFDAQLKPHLTKLVNNIRKNCKNIILIINTFFRKIPKDILQFLLNQEVDGIGIDFICNTLEEIEKIKWKQEKGIFAGILNTMSTKIEDENLVWQFIIDLENNIKPNFIIISGSPDFEFIPLEYATKKIEILQKQSAKYKEENKKVIEFKVQNSNGGSEGNTI